MPLCSNWKKFFRKVLITLVLFFFNSPSQQSRFPRVTRCFLPIPFQLQTSQFFSPFQQPLQPHTLSFFLCKSCQKQTVTFGCLQCFQIRWREKLPNNPQAEITDFQSVRKILLSFGQNEHFPYFNINTNPTQHKQYTPKFTLEEILRSGKIHTMKQDQHTQWRNRCNLISLPLSPQRLQNDKLSKRRLELAMKTFFNAEY